MIFFNLFIHIRCWSSIKWVFLCCCRYYFQKLLQLLLFRYRVSTTDTTAPPFTFSSCVRCCVKWIFSCGPLLLSNVHGALYGVYDMKNSIDNYYFGIRYQISVYSSNSVQLPMNCRSEEQVCWGKLWFVWRSTKSKRQPCRWILNFHLLPNKFPTITFVAPILTLKLYLLYHSHDIRFLSLQNFTFDTNIAEFEVMNHTL